MELSYDHELYLHLDSKTEYFPSSPFSTAKRQRTNRSSRFHFQTADCRYYVSVTVTYADDPEEILHKVKIIIDDDFEEIKQQSFLRNDGRAASVADARNLASIALWQHVEF